MSQATECFGCGHGDESLAIELVPSDGGVAVSFLPRPVHAGLGELVNGGILATVLEEAGAAAASGHAPTGLVVSKLSVEYLAPTEVGSRLVGHAQVTSASGRRIETLMHLESSDGVRIAQAEALFVAQSAERFSALTGMNIEDGPVCGKLLIT